MEIGVDSKTVNHMNKYDVYEHAGIWNILLIYKCIFASLVHDS